MEITPQEATHSCIRRRLPWEDRWAQPSLDQLVDPIESQPAEAIQSLMAQIEGLDRVHRSVTWYGPAWKWTIEYQLVNEAGQDLGVLCYVVPSTASPVVCVPMTVSVIERLPMRRLNRFIRNSVRSAKCAVAIHWALWNLNTPAEVVHLMDLIKRKHKLVSAPPETARR